MCGFWCLTFLVSIVPYWLTFGVAERFEKINKDSNPDDVKSKTLPEQVGVEVLYRK